MDPLSWINFVTTFRINEKIPIKFIEIMTKLQYVNTAKFSYVMFIIIYNSRKTIKFLVGTSYVEMYLCEKILFRDYTDIFCAYPYSVFKDGKEEFQCCFIDNSKYLREAKIIYINTIHINPEYRLPKIYDLIIDENGFDSAKRFRTNAKVILIKDEDIYADPFISYTKMVIVVDYHNNHVYKNFYYHDTLVYRFDIL
jgi:hypothetical protein